MNLKSLTKNLKVITDTYYADAEAILTKRNVSSNF